jgi:hypothetical protein
LTLGVVPILYSIMFRLNFTDFEYPPQQLDDGVTDGVN